MCALICCSGGVGDSRRPQGHQEAACRPLKARTAVVPQGNTDVQAGATAGHLASSSPSDKDQTAWAGRGMTQGQNTEAGRMREDA